MYAAKKERRGLTGRTRIQMCVELTAPTAAQYTTICDTTRGYPDELGSSPPKSVSLPTPGTETGLALGRLFCLNVSCTGQNVTVQRYGLHGDGAWHLFQADVITAGAAAQSITWDPSGYAWADVLIVVLAGGTAPTKVYTNLVIRDLA